MTRALLIALLITAVPVLAGQEEPVDSTRTRNPRVALFLSMVPGAGQLYNHRFVKSALLFTTFSYFTWEQRQAADAYNQAKDSGVNLDDLHRQRNDYAWLMGLTWTIGLLDAFIDAHLWDFDSYEVQDLAPGDSLMIESQSMGTTNDRK